MIKHAIILAGGKGTRLRPYTLAFPKPMLPVGGIPILETILRQLRYHGIETATLSLGYMPEIIQSYFSRLKGDHLPKLEYFIEDEPLGTAGPVRAIAPDAENFLVMNGDVLSTLDFSALSTYHEERDSLLTLAVREAEYQIPLGVVEVDDEQNVTSFTEKPVVRHLDNLGIYVYNRRALDFLEADKPCYVNDLINTLVGVGEKVSVFGTNESYYWIDIGQHGDYEKANEDFARIRESCPYV